MPKHEFDFEVYTNGDYQCITIVTGYDIDISYSINRNINWWVHLLRHKDGSYFLDVQMGNHNAVLLDADRDGCRGVDEDRLEVTAKGRYPVGLLAKALGFVKEYETRIIYAMEELYQESKAA